MSGATCSRCSARVPEQGDRVPRAGFRNVVWIERKPVQVTHTLGLRIWRFHGLTKRAADQVTASDCSLNLCSDCAGGLWLWAQGMDEDASDRDGIGRTVTLGSPEATS